MANLNSGIKSHFGVNKGQRVSQNENLGGQEKGGDNYIHNHINININHNYRGENMRKKGGD